MTDILISKTQYSSNVLYGEFDDARIPSLSASKITSDEFDVERIPTLTADKIPSLNASKITAGVLNRNLTVPSVINLSIRQQGVNWDTTCEGNCKVELYTTQADNYTIITWDGNNRFAILSRANSVFRKVYSNLDILGGFYLSGATGSTVYFWQRNPGATNPFYAVQIL